MVKQARVYIKGDVIGIGFRAWTKIMAKQVEGITGWVKNEYNRPNIFGVGGGVETVIQGEEKKVNLMIKKLEKGPPIARINNIEILWEKPNKVFEEFRIIK